MTARRRSSRRSTERRCCASPDGRVCSSMVVPVVGEYLAPGTVVLRISGGHSDPEPRLVRRVFVLARQRTVDQDPAFALRMLVDIAIRALSPAVNDPTTAVQVLDRIETVLVELAGRRPGPSILVDDDG